MGSAVWSFWEHELKRRHVAQTHLALRRKPYPGTTFEGAGTRLHTGAPARRLRQG